MRLAHIILTVLCCMTVLYYLFISVTTALMIALSCTILLAAADRVIKLSNLK